MDYQIIEKPAFDVVGRGRKFSTVGGKNYVEVPRFWEEFTQTEDYRLLLGLNQGKPGPITGADALGVIRYLPGEDYIPEDKPPIEDFNYIIAVEKPEAEIPAGFETHHITEATWAMFESIGPMPKAIQDVGKRIYGEWLPSSGYEHDYKPDMEVYLPGDPGSPEYHCQVWIPVIKK